MIYHFSNSFNEPLDSDFSLTLRYDESSDSLTAELLNNSDSDYELYCGGESFADLFITCNGGEIPANRDLLLKKVAVNKHSSMTQEFSLNNIAQGECEVYAVAEFYITHPKTGEKYEFAIKSNTVSRS